MKASQKKKVSAKNFPTLNLVSEIDIATDFAKKVYEKFDKLIKSIVLFGSTIKKNEKNTSDIDIVIIIDDASVKFDEELVAWYREELAKIISANPYKKELHVNTVKLTTWWQDILRGDPIALNIIRYGEEIIDVGGFFRPLRVLMQEGKIKLTPEAIYTSLERAPMHLARSKQAEMAAVEGIYWAMVDASQALLMAAKINPESPENIAFLLREHFVKKGLLKSEFLKLYEDVFNLHKGIVHGEIKDIRGKDLDYLQERTASYIGEVAGLIKELVS